MREAMKRRRVVSKFMLTPDQKNGETRDAMFEETVARQATNSSTLQKS
jgi:hypothetical protein